MLAFDSSTATLGTRMFVLMEKKDMTCKHSFKEVKYNTTTCFNAAG